MPLVVDGLEAAEAVASDFGVFEASLLQSVFHCGVVVDILEMVLVVELDLHLVVANLLLASFLVASSVPGAGSAAEMALIPGTFLALGTARVARAAQAALELVARVALVALTLASAHRVLPRVAWARVVVLVVALIPGGSLVVVPLVLDVLDHSLPGTRILVVFLLVMVLLALEDGVEAGAWWHFHRLLLLLARRLVLLGMAQHCVPTVYRHLCPMPFGLQFRFVALPPLLPLLQQPAAHSVSYKLLLPHLSFLAVRVEQRLPSRFERLLLPPLSAVFHKQLFD